MANLVVNVSPSVVHGSKQFLIMIAGVLLQKELNVECVSATSPFEVLEKRQYGGRRRAIERARFARTDVLVVGITPEVDLSWQ